MKISPWTFHLGPIDKPYNYKLSIIKFKFKSKYIANIPHKINIHIMIASSFDLLNINAQRKNIT